MIDPKTFVRNPGPPKNQFKEVDGSFNCSEIGCFESVTHGKYDPENKKVYWVCPNGHEGSARLIYE